MRALVFAHYDPHDMVDDYVLHALRCYRPYFDIICICSTARLPPEHQARAKIYADIFIMRPNIGYDFVSWKEGFEALPNAQFDEIVFANDSCYGPCSDIGEFLKRAGALNADLWGAAINHQFQRHVQSFFMGFGPRLLESGFARRFWQSVEIEPDKFQLILRFEVGLSGRAAHEGFRIAGVVEIEQVDVALQERVIADNTLNQAGEGLQLSAEHSEAVATLIRSDPCPSPKQLYWAESLRRGSPFVKIELLRDNPLGANLNRLRQKLGVDNWYDVGLIDRHLERVAPSAQWFHTRDGVVDDAVR